jgi:septal ring factor EnvC (AmiA/AmiB activator)
MAADASSTPPHFEFTGEVPVAIARAVASIAFHEALLRQNSAKLARFDEKVEAFDECIARVRADAATRRSAADEPSQAASARAAAHAARARLREAIDIYVRQLKADAVPPHHMRQSSSHPLNGDYLPNACAGASVG